MGAKPPDLSRTKGIRIGATMLFHPHSGNNDFAADEAVYNKVYEFGYRAVQVQPSGQDDNWLAGLKQWAEGRSEETHVHTIDFLVNVGNEPACPVSEDVAVRQRARENFEQHLTKAALCGSRSHFGPYTAGLLAGHYPWTPAHDVRCVEFLSWANGIAANASMTVEFEPLNRFETGVSTLDHMWRLFSEAKTGVFMTLGPDTFHQNEGESSTVAAWGRHNKHFGKTGHLSDNGRAVIGDQQALTMTGVFPFLTTGLCSVETWNVEAFGKDVDPGIAAALCLRVLPRHTGLEVMRLSFDRIVNEFSRC